MTIVFTIFLSSISLYILAKSCQEWHQFFAALNLPSGSEEVPVEVPPENVPPARYDVGAFSRRMEQMKASMDEDGLFDVPSSPPPPTDFTGTEWITGQTEMDLERYRR